ncbi:MAG: hypothetical protein KA740_06895 [Rhodoferax sp.]|jgi:hypothetical protein|nr:hypothetical protein [Rhodoferax sp.]
MKPNLSRWRFFRAGGFDQVRLETAAELLAIGELDQKLWVALACPTKGVEFDARTLSFVDSDTDGFVRAPELISAVQWAGERLTQPEVLVKMLPGVPLSAIKTDDEAGAAIAAAAREALAHSGGTDDMVTVEAASAAHQRFADLALAAWEAAGAEVKPLGDATDAAYVAMTAVQAKVDDWFVRCSLAAFDARAGDAMNASGDALTALGGVSLKGDTDGIAALPLAHVRAQAELPLATGLNPAWAAPMAAFYAAVVTPLLGELSHLTSPQWQSLKDKLTPYGTWLGTKPDPLAQGEGVRDLEKLACFTRDLLTLANNFVAFKDFYSRQGPATFQIGTLYIDERACDLCVAVNDAGKHASMAGLSRVCLIYVDCVRGAEKMSVAAAMTAGDVSYLMVGRNGVFYDRKGQDWNATITKLVDNPISLRQAFWSPYKRMARLVSEQLQKMAASKAKASEDQLGNMAQATTQKAVTAPAKAAPPAQPTPFDVGKFAGIFAAIGLALGALGTALVSALSGLFSLSWWQIPLALGGVVLLISLPAVVFAWFKLRSRNLGPILDANGWAVNARARINIPFGTSLTHLAKLPANAERSMQDPYAEESKPWGWYFVLLIAAGAGLAGYLGWWAL